MPNAYLKPSVDADGKPVLVRDPLTLHALKPEGEWKVLSPYWTRRLRDKDVIDDTANAPAPASAPAAPAPSTAPAEPRPTVPPASKPA